MGVISLLLILVTFGPFFMAATMGKSDQRTLKRNFRKTVKDLGLHLSPKEQWAHFFIGIDSREGVLLYINGLGQKQTVHRLALQGLQDCQIHTEQRAYRTKNRMEAMLEQVELELRFGPKRAPVRLLFYQKSDAYGEHLELQRAERWREHILRNARRNKPIREAA